MSERERLAQWLEDNVDPRNKADVSLAEAAWQAALADRPAEPNWQPVPPRACVKPTHEAAEAFWKYWSENGDTHKHGFYESTWGAINAALAFGWDRPEPAQPLVELDGGYHRGLADGFDEAKRQMAQEPAQPVAHVVADVDGGNKRVAFYSTVALQDVPVFTKLYAAPQEQAAQVRAAIDLLQRIRQWDHLPLTADGPFWIKEIDRVLAAAPALGEGER